MTDHSARPDAPASPGEPSPQHDYVPTLDIARHTARRMLNKYGGGTRNRDEFALAEAYGALTTSLGQLLDALDIEVPR